MQSLSPLPLYGILCLFLSLMSCSEAPAPTDPDAQRIVDQSIQAHGMDHFHKEQVHFTFRDAQYAFQQDGGHFAYTKEHRDSAGKHIKDIFCNEGLARRVNDQAVELEEEKRKKFGSAINSVMYFAFLPHRLNDDAVIKEYLGTDTLKGKVYDKVRITFHTEGGGDDHDDVFVYWFNSETHLLDYLAYSYHVNGGGMRFRAAYNRRVKEGITFQDYKNYKIIGDFKIENLGQALNAEKLEEVSQIKLESLKVL